MGLITSAGTGSGLDLEAIISALMNAERAPREAQFSRQESRAENTLSGLGKLKSALGTLEDSLEDLKTLSDFQVRSATSSDEEKLTVSATSDSAPANFSITVDQLAQGSRMQSGTFADSQQTVGSGDLTFTAGSQTFTVTVDAADTLEDIRDKINSAADNIGVNANIINGASGSVLTFDSEIMGNGNDLVVTNSDASLNSISTAMTTTQNAQSAQVQVNGITVLSDSNTFDKAVDGVEFTLESGAQIGDTINIGVSRDKEGLKEKIKEFVDAYNGFIDTASQLGNATEGAQGALVGDSTLRLLRNSMRSILQNPVAGMTSATDTLAEIGITTDRNGKLEIDDDMFDDVMENQFDLVGEIFANDGDTGISAQILSLTDQYTNSSGVITNREDSLNQQLDRIEDQRIALDFRMEQIEVRLRSQFGALDATVSQLNFTGSYLATQMASLIA